MMKRFVTAMAVTLAIAPAGWGQILEGQTDAFAAGKDNWAVGGTSPSQPVWVATGGPAGVGDGFLQATSTGGLGAGSRLAVFNRSQWAADFLPNSIGRIELDLRNFSATPLDLRVGFEDGTGATLFVSTVSYALPGNGGWLHAVLPISATDLTRVAGTKTYEQTMSTVVEMRLISAAAVQWQGDVVAASVGIDNVMAVVPEPGTYALVFALATPAIALVIRTTGRRRPPGSSTSVRSTTA